ncbi:MAG: hypothetical protein A2Z38_11250 [Planctomycetes bacterium RBG_19FT_COMBO_48_8]|nr:MAG: hypothetical protein A2Z38_11250 [Planctomycetes bacterium RBG_19FT_COMBO_48_8]
MKNHYFAKISLGCLLCLVMFMAGCISISGCSMRATYERTVQLSAPLSPGSAFKAQTHNGSIKINGADVTDCNMTATIVARAATDEEAQELSGKVKVTLVPSGNRLITKIDKPTQLINKSVSVSLDVEVPNKTDLELVTHNGAVEISDITGRLNATTHNGKVTSERVSGTTALNTHNGSVTCGEISGSTQLKSHNGSIKAFYTDTAPSVCDISIITHNGGIELKTPPNFSARVNASTHNGSINTDLPITVSGKISKSSLTGTIGTGEGQLHLETHNGSIRIR